MSIFRTEPMLVGGFLQALVLALSVFVFKWEAEEVAAAQGVVLAFVAMLVRQSVMPTAKLPELATRVGVEVAENLTTTTVGAVSQVTTAATHVIDQAVGHVLDEGDH